MCTIITSSPNEGSQLGINMNGVSYWSSAWTFIDLIKQASGWIVQHIDQLDVLYIWNTNERLNRTSTQYPASIPFNRQAVTLMLRDVNNSWPNDIYYVFYDGEGSINFGFDATIIERGDKHKMKIQVNLTKILTQFLNTQMNLQDKQQQKRDMSELDRIELDRYLNGLDKELADLIITHNTRTFIELKQLVNSLGPISTKPINVNYASKLLNKGKFVYNVLPTIFR